MKKGRKFENMKKISMKKKIERSKWKVELSIDWYRIKQREEGETRGSSTYPKLES